MRLGRDTAARQPIAGDTTRTSSLLKRAAPAVLFAHSPLAATRPLSNNATWHSTARALLTIQKKALSGAHTGDCMVSAQSQAHHTDPEPARSGAYGLAR